MKNILLAFFGMIALGQGLQAQTDAADFTATDCNGVSHNLYSELDSGKVVVVCWVMPCGGCYTPALTTHNVVQSYATSHPGKVRFYMADDFADTDCSSLQSWPGTNMPNTQAFFSTSSLSQAAYGGNGMPHIVVFGRTTHNIFYNAKNSVNAAALQAGIDSALAPAWTPAGLSDLSTISSRLTIFPNPVSGFADFSYALTNASVVTIETYNLLGEKMQVVYSGRQTAGEHTLSLDCTGLSEGVYLLKIKADGETKVKRFSVSR